MQASVHHVNISVPHQLEYHAKQKDTSAQYQDVWQP